MSDPRQFKDAIYDPFARMGKAVASPRRLELLDLLEEEGIPEWRARGLPVEVSPQAAP